MYLTDYHLHTLCSPDGHAPLADMAAAALAAGLSEICVTDHCDLLDMEGRPDRSFRWGPIQEQLALARPQFAGKLPIKMGLELGEAWEDPAWARELVALPELDFVIGSVHNLDAGHGGIDFFFVSYDGPARCYEVLDVYFDCMERLTELPCFDILGHVIYPLRYMVQRDGCRVELERYLPQLERIFRALLAQDKAIEVNTCRGAQVEQWREILALYRDCGGRFVTFGSDAHRPGDVAKGIRDAAALVKGFGLRQAVYHRHQPTLIDL